MARGSYQAKIDEKSRLRIPAQYRRELSETGDDAYFVTSFDGKSALIYPLAVWIERFEKKFQEAPRTDKYINDLKTITNYYGLETQMDPQGRILIPTELRETAKLSGDVKVLGQGDYLEVKNEAECKANLPVLTDAHWEHLAERGI